jgi:hypothetical protein
MKTLKPIPYCKVENDDSLPTTMSAFSGELGSGAADGTPKVSRTDGPAEIVLYSGNKLD